MESKTMKYFDILFEMCKSDFERRPEAVETGLKKLMDLDHSQFLEVWEYVCTRYDGLLTNPYCSPAMTANVFAALAKKSEVRAAKLSENAFLFRTLWTGSSTPVSEAGREWVLKLLLTQKFDRAEEIFKAVMKNGVMGMTFGGYFKQIFEAYADRAVDKTAAVPKLKRPAAKYLLSVAERIKGPEKALITQRINELL